MNITHLKESIKINIIENFKKKSKSEHAPRGPAHQRPKHFGKGGKSGTERTQERQKGKREAREDMYEDVETTTSVYRPVTSPQGFAPSPEATPISSKKKKLTSREDYPTPNTVQTELTKSLLNKPVNKLHGELHHNNTDVVGGPRPVNTQDTPQIKFNLGQEFMKASPQEREAMARGMMSIGMGELNRLRTKKPGSSIEPK
jgi:hypothetical protein